MEGAISRLERVAERLERLEVDRSLSSGGGSRQAAAPSTAPPSRAAPPPAAVPAAAVPGPVQPSGDALAAYDQYCAAYVQPFVAASQTLAPEVTKAVHHLDQAFKGVRQVLDVARRTQRAEEGAALQALVAPVAAELVAATALTEGRRAAAFNHLKVVADCLQGLSWIVYNGPACGMSPPPQFVADAWQSSEFYANRITMEFKGKDESQVVWVRALKELMSKLEHYVRCNCPNGLPWGQAASSTSSSAPTPAAAPPPSPPPPAAVRPAAPRAGPPPPPPPGRPPPPPSVAELTSSSAPAATKGGAPSGMDALFLQLQKGEGVTSGLKKVTDDMKTKNQPAGARSGVVAAAAGSSAAGGSRPPAAAASVKVLTPRFELLDKKWVVEHQVGRQDLVINVTNPAHIVYVYGCKGCVLQVKGKMNAVTLDGCSKTGLVFEEVIAACELVNCSRVQVQCTGKVATISVEKSDGCQLFVTAQAAAHPDFQVVTAKCSEVNITVAGASEDADSSEHPVPEQFITTFRNGQLITAAVAHSGA